mmetsp:Transcript_63865/g.152314  ORF Transcript_63865/g.152314 Transcript_63865/m.152314 type:complete len:323 (-) Transcript_63865:34-1002(-)
MAGEAIATCLGVTCCLIIIIVWQSVSILLPTEMGLWYNPWLQTVDPVVEIQGGMKFRPFNTLLKYPLTVQTIVYDESHQDVLDGRTQDGLPLILGVSFQYQLLPDGDHLYQLYKSYEEEHGDYEKVFWLVGIHMITELATNFTAYKFFNEKQHITQVMQSALDTYFQQNLHARVVSLQIGEDDLPSAFTDVVLEAATCAQNITRMQRVLEARQVEFQTKRLVAEAQANVTIAKATGDASKIKQLAEADAAIIEAYVSAEKTAYTKIKEDLNLKGTDLINYIWYDSLGGGGFGSSQGEKVTEDTSVLVGINPAAYINSKSDAR